MPFNKEYDPDATFTPEKVRQALIERQAHSPGGATAEQLLHWMLPDVENPPRDVTVAFYGVLKGIQKRHKDVRRDDKTKLWNIISDQKPIGKPTEDIVPTTEVVPEVAIDLSFLTPGLQILSQTPSKCAPAFKNLFRPFTMSFAPKHFALAELFVGDSPNVNGKWDPVPVKPNGQVILSPEEPNFSAFPYTHRKYIKIVVRTNSGEEMSTVGQLLDGWILYVE